MVYGRAGRLADARRIGEELTSGRAVGSMSRPPASWRWPSGLDDRALVQQCLAACADGGAAPFSVVATNRWLLDGLRGDPAIDALLDRLHDGARPSP